ncbi:MAG: oligopeptide transporter, OPT family [Pseudomonadota bacterium]
MSQDAASKTQLKGLPENAFRELGKGEVYAPLVSPKEKIAEVTVRSVLIGILMSIIFSGSIAYLTLKIGTGLEAAIPIAIIAVGLSYAYRRRSTLLENIMIVAIGSTSGIVVGGAVFTLPALYIMGLEGYTNLFQLFLIPMLGSIIGVILLIPLRRYFVEEMHGKFPFPEATATTEILVAGRKGGRDARVLAYTMLIGGVYDFLASAMGAWRDTFTTGIIGACSMLTTKFKVVFSISTGAAITAMGYIIGLRYMSIMIAGSALSWMVLVPLVAYVDSNIGSGSLALLTNQDIFSAHVRMIGIGGIFMAGIIGIMKSLPVMYRAFGTGFKELFESKKEHVREEQVVPRTERDIRMYVSVVMLVATLIGLFIYFRYSVLSGQPNPFMLGVIALVVTFVLGFLFNSVSAYAIATIGTTPISGMTLMTLVIACILLSKAGLSGESGMVSALLVGGVVCTALSMAGSLVTQFKISYWLGATPRRIEWANIGGSLIAAVVCSFVIVMLAKVYGFAPSPEHANPLPAPQANAMAAVIKGLMMGGTAPWFLYAIGAVIAILMELIGVAPLAFALGMYLPFDLVAPMFVGALVATAVKYGSKDEKEEERRHSRGTLVSSGLIAGGALMGVVGALIEWLSAEVFKGDILPKFGNDGLFGNWMGLGMLILLCAYMYWDSKRIKA